MYVVAGCNGSGKSTFLRSIVEFHGMVVIDPDALFAELQSWREVVTRLGDALDRRSDFVVETTLSGKRMLQRMRTARKLGFDVSVVFIGTSSPALNVGRIATRTQLGGHAISVQDVLRRWRSSLTHLREAAKIADNVLVLDNSSMDERFIVVAEIKRNAVARSAHVPSWATAALDEIGSEA